MFPDQSVKKHINWKRAVESNHSEFKSIEELSVSETGITLLVCCCPSDPPHKDI